MDQERLGELAAEVLESMGEIVGKVKRIHGGLASVIAAAPEIVRHVEVIAVTRSLDGQQKKKLAVEVALKLIPDRWAPDWVLRPAIGWIIEQGVDEVKRRGGPLALLRSGYVALRK